MTDSTPRGAPRPRREDGASALSHAINAERAQTLGKLGRTVERQLAALSQLDAAVDRKAFVAAEYACAESVWHYFVQRESAGLIDHTAVIEHYRIPQSVLAKVGARPR